MWVWLKPCWPHRHRGNTLRKQARKEWKLLNDEMWCPKCFSYYQSPYKIKLLHLFLMFICFFYLPWKTQRQEGMLLKIRLLSYILKPVCFEDWSPCLDLWLGLFYCFFFLSLSTNYFYHLTFLFFLIDQATSGKGTWKTSFCNGYGGSGGLCESGGDI